MKRGNRFTQLGDASRTHNESTQHPGIGRFSIGRVSLDGFAEVERGGWEKSGIVDDVLEQCAEGRRHGVT